MTHIEVLGPGCQKCKVLFEHAEQAAKELGLEFEIKKVTDISAIMGYGVLSTPALVVNGELKLAGRVPSAEQLKGFLS
ncbi:MAG: redox-active disulfide protein 2 [Candidatus Eisenbacteria bacterium RBG_19FT_COMBO_70_11]|nr:MAG: redox-active disulfide protein 2 [Candidatus Eisenbacteria bacterium RBG_19FT_COMBO_70_11]